MSPQLDKEAALARVLAAALAAVEPGQAVRAHVAVEHDELVVARQRYALSDYRQVVVVGVGLRHEGAVGAESRDGGV